MKLGTLAAFAALVIGAAPDLSAQQAALRPAPSILFVVEAPSKAADTTTLSRTYWKEGALITGVPSAVFGGMLGFAFCGRDEWYHSDCTLGALKGAVLLGLIGAVPGGLIGALFTKPE